jgi:pre-mRNA-processing factor 17
VLSIVSYGTTDDDEFNPNIGRNQQIQSKNVLKLDTLGSSIVYTQLTESKLGLEKNQKRFPLQKIELTNLNGYQYDEQYKNHDKFGFANNLETERNPNTIVNPRKETVSINPVFSWRFSEKKANRSLKPILTAGLYEDDRTYLQDALAQRNKTSPSTAQAVTFSTFHRRRTSDWLGRSWLEPNELGSTPNQFYLPKKLIHCWSGHEKGVQKILWFPNSAHLLLSAGLDNKIKIWDVHNQRHCICTYNGHNRGIRDITFTNDGKSFVSSSFDRNIKMWDTETGKVKCVIARDKLGYALRFHPDEDKQNMLLVGCSDRKIYQFDVNSGEIVQEYDRHLDAVNTITFINQNRWFLTTSDDKTIRVWEYGIPEQIKYIADPSMNAYPYVSVVPGGRRLLMQCMDNSIHTYNANDKISLEKKKIFKGHSNAGFGCQVGTSPDGRYIVSGDGLGKCYFWDWKTTRITRTIKAHQNACIGVIWHPNESSKVATCGWGDNLIKYWD